MASTVRLLLVAGAGAWLASGEATAGSYFWLVAAAMVAYGLSTAVAVKFTPWGRRT